MLRPQRAAQHLAVGRARQLGDEVDGARALVAGQVLAGGWAGVALGDNFLLLFVALQVFLFVLIRWLRARGYQPEFMVVRDDYKDDHGPK